MFPIASRLMLCLLLAAGFAAPGQSLLAAPARAAEAVAPTGLRVVILPFRNLTRTPADDWLGESFAESLIMGLLKVEALQLVERGQIGMVLQEQQFGQSAYVDEASAPRLGKLLGAKVVVLGSFQKVGDQLLANVRFVDVETGQIDARRSAQVQGGFAQIFDLQKQLAADLVTQLQVKARPDEIAGMDRVLMATDSPEAYKLYNEGMQLMRKGDSQMIDKARTAFTQALAIDPDYALALAGLAEVHARKARDHDILRVPPPDMQMGVRGPDDAALARRYAERALALNPELSQVLRAMAWVEQTEGRRDEALTLIKRALKINPRDSDSLMAYVSLRFENSDLIFDVVQLRQELSALGASLDDPWVQFTLGALGTGLEAVKAVPRLDGPRALLESAERKLPDNPYIPMTLASIAAREGKQELAERYFQRAQSLGQDSAELLSTLVAIRLGQRRFDEAHTLALKAYGISPQNTYVQVMLADSHYGLGRKAEAEAIYERLLANDPGNTFIAYNRALKYLIFDQDLLRARAGMQKALSLWEQRPSGLPRSMLIYFLALCEFNHKDYASAQPHLESLLKDPIYYGSAYEMLAELHADAQRFPEALEAYTAYVTIHAEEKSAEKVQRNYRWYFLLEQLSREPGNAAVLNDLGSLAQQRKAPGKAEDYWLKALAVDGQNAVVLNNLGAFYLETGKPDLALPLLERAVSARPDYAKAWYHLGMARQQAGDAAGAKTAWQKVLSLEPAHQGALEALKQ